MGKVLSFVNHMNEFNLKAYEYNLPQHKIALYPLAKRDDSKLLVSKGEVIEHSTFQQLPQYLPNNSFLFFNNTKVIPARLQFVKNTGAEIEIFLLNPLSPSTLLTEVMQERKACRWHCTIGNLKRWTNETTLTKENKSVTLEARLLNREEGIVQFEWSGNTTFADIIDTIGVTPLPPYLKRAAEVTDRERYQTIYSNIEGAVAAPTAGLHFTKEVFEQLQAKNILHDFLTLHVSAGTFQPIKTENVNEHIMHQEQIVVRRHNIENLLRQDRFIVPVGTTSMRTLESLYWYGAKVLRDESIPFIVDQNDPYTINDPPSIEKSLRAVLSVMDQKQTDLLTGETSIFIKPGYKFKVCKGLITNFHQPGSTLILLVAAFVGEHWKKIYEEALKNDYRFLSYGDSSFLIRED
jgi:S-adenosylmethionine:tRNA ribosyltransferase-isomerase